MQPGPHIAVRPDWLALRQEAALDPARPIIDAHHHLWDNPGDRFLADEFVVERAGHRIVASVFVEGGAAYRVEGPEALRPVGETEMAARQGARASTQGVRMAAAIIARADLAQGAAVAAALDAHAEAGGGRFRGIRHATPWHPDPSARGSVRAAPAGQLHDPAFRAGLAELQARDLVFDAWMYHTQLGDLVDLARAMPGLRIVLDHVGGPLGIGPYRGRRDEVFADWRHWMARLAAYPNVDVKLSGFGMRLFGFDFAARPAPPSSADLAEALRPYAETCIEAFGADRAMFGSNFPVDKGVAPCAVLWNAFKRLTAGLSAAERDALFFGSANRAYSLGLEQLRQADRTEVQ